MPTADIGLADRLRDGVGGTLSRTNADALRPQALTTCAVWERLRTMDEHTRRGNASPQRVTADLHHLAATLAADRDALLTLLLDQPGAVHTAAAELGLHHSDIVAIWPPICLLAEAAWLAVKRVADHAPGTDEAFTASDAALLTPAAARLRFLALSEPARHRDWPGSAALPASPARLTSLLGSQSLHELVARAREARWTWLRLLDEYQSHPLMAGARPADIEHDLAALLFHGPDNGRLLLSTAAYTSRAPASRRPAHVRVSADDQTVAAEATDRHLLPRMRLVQVMRLGAERHLPWWLPAAAMLAALTGVGMLAGQHRFGWAAVTAGAAYALVALGVIVFGQLWGSQWLLRLPAAGAVGLFVLLTLPPDWWLHPSPRWPAYAILAAASYGYLVIEARNHGVAALPAAGRALTVGLAGAVHGLLIALIGLVGVAPSVVQQGHDLAVLWTTGKPSQVWAVLGLAALWCLTVGVFSQILWDDRPITASLAHLQWRRGR